MSLKDSFGPCIDAYLRRRDTIVAKSLSSICSLQGEEYLHSSYRRALDLAVAVPATLIALPVMGMLLLARKLEDPGGSVFFVHPRVNYDGSVIHVRKIRCMYEGSDSGRQNLAISTGRRPEDDPRNTPLGRFMRKYQLEELPQLFDVIAGRMSVVGLRAAATYDFEYQDMHWGTDNKKATFRAAYHAGRLGLTGVNQVVLSDGLKLSRDRYHGDVFYARKASLGLDTYLLWRTLRKLIM